MTEIRTSYSISLDKIPSRYLKCPNCNKTINYEMVKSILMDALARNTRPFKPSDPVILSETEVYCNTDCYAIAVVREELEED